MPLSLAVENDAVSLGLPAAVVHRLLPRCNAPCGLCDSVTVGSYTRTNHLCLVPGPHLRHDGPCQFIGPCGRNRAGKPRETVEDL